MTHRSVRASSLGIILSSNNYYYHTKMSSRGKCAENSMSLSPRQLLCLFCMTLDVSLKFSNSPSLFVKYSLSILTHQTYRKMACCGATVVPGLVPTHWWVKLGLQATASILVSGAGSQGLLLQDMPLYSTLLLSRQGALRQSQANWYIPLLWLQWLA